MEIKIVTAIYDGLFGTDLGGRPGRFYQYRYSLKSLLKMTDAYFVCYTSSNEIESLKHFFYDESGFDETRIKFKNFDLRNFRYSDKINKLKDIEKTKTSDRCIEIQYSKFIWLLNEIHDNNYEYIFWFDAGLSHNGIIPKKHLNQTSENPYERLYETELFNNKLLENLVSLGKFEPSSAGDSIVIVSKDNLGSNFWSQTVPEKYYYDYKKDRHIIGGFFGGKITLVSFFCRLFFKYLEILLDNEKDLFFEEQIMTLIYYNHTHWFTPLKFDLWWHEDQKISGIDDMTEYIGNRKSFYKVLEELNG